MTMKRLAALLVALLAFVAAPALGDEPVAIVSTGFNGDTKAEPALFVLDDKDQLRFVEEHRQSDYEVVAPEPGTPLMWLIDDNRAEYWRYRAVDAAGTTWADWFIYWDGTGPGTRTDGMIVWKRWLVSWGRDRDFKPFLVLANKFLPEQGRRRLIPWDGMIANVIDTGKWLWIWNRDGRVVRVSKAHERQHAELLWTEWIAFDGEDIWGVGGSQGLSIVQYQDVEDVDVLSNLTFTDWSLSWRSRDYTWRTAASPEGVLVVGFDDLWFLRPGTAPRRATLPNIRDQIAVLPGGRPLVSHFDEYEHGPFDLRILDAELQVEKSIELRAWTEMVGPAK